MARLFVPRVLSANATDSPGMKKAGRMARMFVRLRKVTRNDQIILSLMAVVAGAVVAYGSIGFRWLVGVVQHLFYSDPLEQLLSVVILLPWWQILLAPAVGGLVIGLFLKFIMPGGRPLGVAHVIESGALNGGRMSLNQALGAAFVSAASIGVGGSAGREGPMVHFGAALASWIARRFHLTPSITLTLLGCGVASGVAASFNAPIAGVFFALEVVIGHYALHAFSPIVIASVVGTIVSRAHLGDTPAFQIIQHVPVHLTEYPAFFLLGLCCAVIAWLLVSTIALTDKGFSRSPLPVWLRPAFGGLMVGAIALYYPHVLGVGYQATDMALSGTFGLWMLLALLVAKTLATALTIGSGFGGGVFSPALFVGAMTGGAFGVVAGSVFPDQASGIGLYAMVGMGAVAAPVLGAPISTILIVFELTGDYSMTIAAMIAVSVASVTMLQVFGGKSFFNWQLDQRGLDLGGGRARQVLAARHAEDVMADDFLTIPEHTTMDRIRQTLRDSVDDHIFVVDHEDHLIGSMSFTDIKDVAFEAGLDHLINARDASRPNPVHVARHESLEKVLALMDSSGLLYIPVVDNLDNMRVVGLVHHRRVLTEYNKALLDMHAEEHGEKPGR
jgi:chloride channel protein, CIC family